MRHLVLFALPTLVACQHGPAPEPPTNYVRAAVAVSAGCVVDPPAEVVPLKQRVPDAEWNARAPGAKAQTFKEQAGLHMNYETDLRRATKACKTAIAGTP